MKGLRELYPSIQLVFSLDFAEAFVCFVGFLSGEWAVSVAALIEGKATDEAATPVRGEGLLYLTIFIENNY